MENFFNKILCDLVGHRESQEKSNTYDVIQKSGLKFDTNKFMRAYNICVDGLNILPSRTIKCERCGKILKNGPEKFIQVYKYL